MSYTFFDIPTKAPQVCWSMNTWRTRLVLNYKGLDYKTEWLEYPEIEAVLKEHVPPNEKGPQYTLPAIKMPDGTYVMDSYKIVDVLEDKHPDPKLPLDAALQGRFRPILSASMGNLTAIYVPRVAKRLLGDGSMDFFLSTREEFLGMPLHEYGEKSGPGSFDKAEPFLRQMTELLNETSGPYFLGEVVSYTDFIWAAILLFFRELGEEEYREVLERSGDSLAHTKFLDALSPWTKRNDH